jgi:hypothetical protein
MKQSYKFLSLALSLSLSGIYGMSTDSSFAIIEDATRPSTHSAQFQECAAKLLQIIMPPVTAQPRLQPQNLRPLRFGCSPWYLLLFGSYSVAFAHQQTFENTRNDRVKGWLNDSAATITPHQVFEIIANLEEDKQATITQLAIEHYRNLLRSPSCILIMEDFPYQVLDIQPDNCFNFRVLSAPLEGAPVEYNVFAAATYELLINGVYDPTPLKTLKDLPASRSTLMESIINTAPHIMMAFAEFFQSLKPFDNHPLAQNRHHLIRATAHALYDFNRQHQGYWNVVTSTSHLLSGTSLVSEAQVTLRGEVVSL